MAAKRASVRTRSCAERCSDSTCRNGRRMRVATAAILPAGSSPSGWPRSSRATAAALWCNATIAATSSGSESSASRASSGLPVAESGGSLGVRANSGPVAFRARDSPTGPGGARDTFMRVRATRSVSGPTSKLIATSAMPRRSIMGPISGSCRPASPTRPSVTPAWGK